MGGAIFNNGGSCSAISCTFTANSAIGGTGTNNGYGYGGAIFSRNGALTLLNDTISANSAANGGRGVYVLGDGAQAAAEIDNTVIGQSDSSITDLVTNAINGGSFVTGGGNDLIRNTVAAGIAFSNADPLLNPLASNGGPTQTMSFQAGSPAIGGGNVALAPSTDQRGYARPSGYTTDIGAYALSGTSAYSFQAYQDAYYCFYYAQYAYAQGLGSYDTLRYAYASFYYAYYAFYYDAIGQTAGSVQCAYYAYYFGYVAYVDAYADWAYSGGTSWGSYCAFYYGYYDWNYSYCTAIGL
jgi:hypothetical protein